jgi:SNF2 family DNA or RNA helicase
MSVATGNVGITLTTGNNMILLTIPWLPSEIEQCIARLDRIGQKNTVKVFIPIIKDTVDEQVYDLVHNKNLIISKAIDNIDYEDVSDSSVLSELLGKYKNKYKKN